MQAGISHRPLSFDRLTAALVECGLPAERITWLDQATYPQPTSFGKGAVAVSQQFAGERLIVVGHSMAGPVISHLVAHAPQQVGGVILFAPAGPELLAGIPSFFNLARICGWRNYFYFLLHASLPTRQSRVAGLLYPPEMGADEQATRLQGLRLEPFTQYHVGIINPELWHLYPRPPAKLPPALVLRHKEDRFLTGQWVAAAAKWYQAELRDINGTHNQFETEAGAKEAADIIMKQLKTWNLLDD